ncbi:ASC domain containing protein, partial [Asbolus verrucosus]
VLVHSSFNVPRLSKNYFRVPVNKEVVVAVEPELIVTSDAVKNFGPKERKCYLKSERFLRHFKVYTQVNYLLECLTNYTLNKCGCVTFFMPRDNETAICGTGSADCVDEAESRNLNNYK